MKLIVRKRNINHIPLLEVFPESEKNNPLPLVVYYHGWQTSKELALTPARKIAQKNIRVIIPDAMNHGERRIHEKSSIPSFTFWSSIQHNISEFDLLIHYFNERDLIKDHQIGVGGYSMGGMTTAALLTHHDNIQSASILMGTPDFDGFINQMKQHVQQSPHLTMPVDISDMLSWTQRYDLSVMPEKIAGRPIYFWHGTHDEKIPYEASHDFYIAHKDTFYGQNMVYDTGIGKPHLITSDIMLKTADFFDKQLNTAK